MIKNTNYRLCLRSIKFTTRHNILKVHAKNSYEHEKLKFDIVYLLRRAEHNVATEVEFIDGGRADILDLDEAVVYEVLQKESMEEFNKKKDKYPRFLTVIPVKVGAFPFEELIKFLGVD